MTLAFSLAALAHYVSLKHPISDVPPEHLTSYITSSMFRARTIVAETGNPESNAHVITATTILAFAVSSIMTGVVFLLLGGLKLGSLVGYFPRYEDRRLLSSVAGHNVLTNCDERITRHILVGCIG